MLVGVLKLSCGISGNNPLLSCGVSGNNPLLLCATRPCPGASYNAVGFSYGDDNQAAPPPTLEDPSVAGNPPLPPDNPPDEALEAAAARFGLQGFADLLREAELLAADEDAARVLRLRCVAFAGFWEDSGTSRLIQRCCTHESLCADMYVCLDLRACVDTFVHEHTSLNRVERRQHITTRDCCQHTVTVAQAAGWAAPAAC